MKTKFTYYFFADNGKKIIIIDEITCIAPRRTNIYRDLVDAFNKGIIIGYGYTNNKENLIY